MNRKHRIIAVLFSLLTGYILFSSNSTFAPVSPTGHTGAPGESTCATCHAGMPNMGTGGIEFFVSGSAYAPDSVYTLSLHAIHNGKNIYGFQATALDLSDNAAGIFSITDSVKTFFTENTNTNRSYVSHFHASDNKEWHFDWKAPAANIGPVVFYYALNIADASGDATGDSIYTGSFTFHPDTIIDTTTLIRNVSLHPEAAVFPNPVYDRVNVRVNKGGLHHITLVDAAGRAALRLAIHANTGEIIGIDVLSQPAGLYFLKIQTGTQVAVKKVMLAG